MQVDRVAHLETNMTTFMGWVLGGLAGAVLSLDGAVQGHASSWQTAAVVVPLGAMFGGWAGYFKATERKVSWKEDGRKRKRDEEANRVWRKQFFWQEEARRVMRSAAESTASKKEHSRSSTTFRPAESAKDQAERKKAAEEAAAEAARVKAERLKAEEAAAGAEKAKAEGAKVEETAEAEAWRLMTDYELLGLQKPPPPLTAETVAAAFRREAMRYHPDHDASTEERFKAISAAHARIRRTVSGGWGQYYK